jgi:hypothetical protein
MVIAIFGYLTQSKLAEALQQFITDGWLGNEVAIPGKPSAVGYGVSAREKDHGPRVRRG